LGQAERLDVPGPGPVGDVRSVDVDDARQVVRRGRGHDGVVVGVLGEVLDLDRVLVLAVVEVLDDRVDDPELGLVATGVGPQVDGRGTVGVVAAGTSAACGCARDSEDG